MLSCAEITLGRGGSLVSFLHDDQQVENYVVESFDVARIKKLCLVSSQHPRYLVAQLTFYYKYYHLRVHDDIIVIAAQ